nr:MAG TPA: hypothetical protein [Herelleviridae sp.]
MRFYEFSCYDTAFRCIILKFNYLYIMMQWSKFYHFLICF